MLNLKHVTKLSNEQAKKHKLDHTQLVRLYRPKNSKWLCILFRKQDGLYKGWVPVSKEDEYILKLCIKEGRRRQKLGIESE